MCRADGTMVYAAFLAGFKSVFTKQIRAYGSAPDETMMNFEDTRGVASVGYCNHGLQSMAMKQKQYIKSHRLDRYKNKHRGQHLPPNLLTNCIRGKIQKCCYQ